MKLTTYKGYIVKFYTRSTRLSLQILSKIISIEKDVIVKKYILIDFLIRVFKSCKIFFLNCKYNPALKIYIDINIRFIVSKVLPKQKYNTNDLETITILNKYNSLYFVLAKHISKAGGYKRKLYIENILPKVFE